MLMDFGFLLARRSFSEGVILAMQNASAAILKL
jgi:hypothetical protein